LRGDGIEFTGGGLLSLAQIVERGLPRCLIDDRR
jgi:hypothetical protein